jgi:hypothetical protein
MPAGVRLVTGPTPPIGISLDSTAANAGAVSCLDASVLRATLPALREDHMVLHRFQVSVTTLLGAMALGACRNVQRVDPPAPADATFVCADSLRRADGTQKSATCVLAREYCYEASGGAAVSHGAHCRPLPKPNATCADVAAGAGSSCTGTPETGIRAAFAYP